PASYHSYHFQPPPPPRTYNLSLHDALPILGRTPSACAPFVQPPVYCPPPVYPGTVVRFTATVLPQTGSGTPTGSVTFFNGATSRSEEHTSELQSRGHIVCRLLLEKLNPPFR